MNKELVTHLATINQNFDFLKKRFGVKKIAIFGSTARGDQTPKSDIDIIVELNKPMGFFEFISLEDYLGKLLGKKVDLTTKKAIKPAIKKTILSEAVSLFH